MRDLQKLENKSMRVDETIKLWKSGYRAIKPAPLANTSLKLSGVWEPSETIMAWAELEIARLRNEYASTHADFTEEEFTNWVELHMKERASKP